MQQYPVEKKTIKCLNMCACRRINEEQKSVNQPPAITIWVTQSVCGFWLLILLQQYISIRHWHSPILNRICMCKLHLSFYFNVNKDFSPYFCGFFSSSSSSLNKMSFGSVVLFTLHISVLWFIVATTFRIGFCRHDVKGILFDCIISQSR